MNQMKAYLFDFNGVLVDDEKVHFQAFRQALSTEQIELDEATYLARYFAFDDATAFTAMLADHERVADSETVAKLIALKLPLYLAAIERDLKLFEGGFELLRACADEGPVAIVSGALRVEIEHILERTRCTDLVKTIVAADDVPRCKPDPMGYLEALRRLAVRAEDAVVIEDSPHGVTAAKSAGIVVIAVAHSVPTDQLKHADCVVEKIGDIQVGLLDLLRTQRWI